MTKIEEIQNKIKDLEAAKFLLNMKDYWSNEDYERDRMFDIKIKEYEELLKNEQLENK